ncbi:hypothetical protein NRS6120_12975 [Bacillus subtilis]|nr:hypothetical protein NRS6120_01914 [Bacillus subtilis]CAI6283764.1 hypothetical protein NRS6120_12975 [Bacillus subtilis]
MGYAGVLVFQEKLNWVLSMLAAGLGRLCGSEHVVSDPV